MSVSVSEVAILAADRVIEEHQRRMTDAQQAMRDWERMPTMSNAIRRDDTKRALLVLSDSYTVAMALKRMAQPKQAPPSLAVDIQIVRNYVEWRHAIHGGGFSSEAAHRQLVAEERPMPSDDEALAAVSRIEEALAG